MARIFHSESTPERYFSFGDLMARKMTLDEMVEFDPNAADAVAEAQAEIEAAQRAARRKKNAPASETDRPTAAILPIYLREMGATPLIDEHREVALARELQEGREGLAKIALKLPVHVRDYVLEGDQEGPKRGREWPLDVMRPSSSMRVVAGLATSWRRHAK